MFRFILAAVAILVSIDFAVTGGANSRHLLGTLQVGARWVAHMGAGSLFTW